MKQKKLYFYNCLTKRSSISEAELIIARPIKDFPRAEGCVIDIGIQLLTKNAIGKKFIIEGLDPVQFGIVTYLGRGKKAFPFGDIYKKMRYFNALDFLTFKKTGKNATIFSINRFFTKIMPVGKRIGNLILEKKSGTGINAEMIVYLVQAIGAPQNKTCDGGIRKIGSVRFCSDKLWVPSRKTKNLRIAASYANKKYPNG